MQDQSDLFTMEKVTAPAPGRPRTATAEKKKEDGARRARRYRENKKAASQGSCAAINRVTNTHEIKLCTATESDFLAIYNWARWLSLAIDANGNPSPHFYGSLSDHTDKIMECVKAIAVRANVVWCNPPINSDLIWFRDEN